MQQQLKHHILDWGLGVLPRIGFVIGLMLCFAIAIFALELPDAAHAQSSHKANSTEPVTLSAQEIFRQAYENRYTWDEKFPGYSAEVSINYHGELDQGIVRVKPILSVDVLNINKDEVRQLIVNQLGMEAIHRRRVPFEQVHGHNRFELAGTDEFGAFKINEVGQMNSRYKVQDKIITQVNRNLGDVAVTVDTLGTAKNSGGYIVTHFQTTFRNPQTGEVIEKQDVRDFHEKIGRFYLLTYRAIRSSKQGNPDFKQDADILIRFNSIQPLRFPNDLVSPV